MKSKIRTRINRMYDAVASIDLLYEEYAEINGIGYLDMLLFYELLEDDEPYTQKRMCDTLEISKTTLNSVIKRWMPEYIGLSLNEGNHREKWIVLTEEGTAYAHKLIDPLFKMEGKAIKLITDDEIETVERIVSKYADALGGQIGKMKGRVKK